MLLTFPGTISVEAYVIVRESILADLPYIVCCPTNGGKKEGAYISEDFCMEPRFT
jgi:hypothetical protein